MKTNYSKNFEVRSIPTSFFHKDLLSKSFDKINLMHQSDLSHLVAQTELENDVRYAIGKKLRLSFDDFERLDVKGIELKKTLFGASKVKSLSFEIKFRTLNKLEAPFQIWCYSLDGLNICGPYQAKDFVKGRLVTRPIQGDQVAIELFTTDPEVYKHLEITEANLGFRPLLVPENADGNCNGEDIGCKDLDIQRVARSTVMIVTDKNQGTGVLLNNHKGDRRPLILTANHVEITTDSIASMTDFYWGYQKTSCKGRSIAIAHVQRGASIVNRSSRGDYCLLELNNPIAPVAKPYFSGWELAKSPVKEGGIGIHHPQGGPKVVATTYNPVYAGECKKRDRGGSKECWRIERWQNGSTRNHSSGSGLWTSKGKRLLGFLMDGESQCRGVAGPDWYQRLQSIWDGTGSDLDNPKPTLRNVLAGDSAINELEGLDSPDTKPEGFKSYLATRIKLTEEKAHFDALGHLKLLTVKSSLLKNSGTGPKNETNEVIYDQYILESKDVERLNSLVMNIPDESSKSELIHLVVAEVFTELKTFMLDKKKLLNARNTRLAPFDFETLNQFEI